MRLAGRAVAVAVAAVLGVAVGVVGSFVFGMSVRFAGVSWVVGLLPALAGLAGLLVLTGSVLGSRKLVLWPAGGWAIGVLRMALPRPEGDLVVPGTLSGYVFLLGGALLIGVCLTLPYDRPGP